MEVTVSLKNPPPGGNYWRLILFNEVLGESLTVGQHIPVSEPIMLDGLPTGWSFPLYIDIFIYENPVSPYNVVYKVQSAYGPDWGDYKDVTIPDYGSYYYNVATEQFEEIAEVIPCEISIDAPDSAAEGEKVSVSVLLKNVSSYGYMYKTEIYAVPDLFPDFRIGTIEKYINSGSSFTAYGSFTMPASNTTILIWVERWAVDHWVYDSSASKVVSLELVVPEYRGTIITKELEYDESRGNIPVY